jgi:hypothetical protein
MPQPQIDQLVQLASQAISKVPPAQQGQAFVQSVTQILSKGGM